MKFVLPMTSFLLSVSGGRRESARRVGEEISEVRPDAASGQNSVDGVWAQGPGQGRETGRSETGDLRFSWIHAYLQAKPPGKFRSACTNDAQTVTAQSESYDGVVPGASA